MNQDTTAHEDIAPYEDDSEKGIDEPSSTFIPSKTYFIAFIVNDDGFRDIRHFNLFSELKDFLKKFPGLTLIRLYRGSERHFATETQVKLT